MGHLQFVKLQFRLHLPERGITPERKQNCHSGNKVLSYIPVIMRIVIYRGFSLHQVFSNSRVSPSDDDVSGFGSGDFGLLRHKLQDDV